ncbi:MAG: hypothetical protein QXH27_03905 [Candidatus Micrarchaeia archaeon]
MESVELYVIAAAALILLAVLAYSVFGLASKPAVAPSAADYQKFAASQLPGDPCATPPGYTDVEWRQHMSHHPDQYAQCLQ